MNHAVSFRERSLGIRTAAGGGGGHSLILGSIAYALGLGQTDLRWQSQGVRDVGDT
jgi:hypothetical protein